ncbi:YheC/YheD family protein [Herbivorax sp. ANBcel31]|uniref:YheC/YheD family protein n=1 Tax=Herbivorax sp. ANBcel31 TaxID=3069754 RepID=UPI0027B36B14|nr:YheC/YheD family protein [Herbivorax sp. ANBcel31]MDQ2087558.1 YheC/YheD family protein [Herbivorax sp. ANBcel31]
MNCKYNKKAKNICTLLTKDYLIQGLALYYSLNKNTSEFLLWILCVDDIAYNMLKEINLENVVVLSLYDIMDEELEKIQKDRQIHEFCWTLKPSFIRFLFENNDNLDSLLYVDADIFFFKDVKDIYKEWEDYSIFLTKLWLNRRWRERVGKYSSGLIGFKRDEISKMCLDSWREKCLNWCYDRQEFGLWGDQKYLDEWRKMFSGVKVSKNKGINAGPWNINRGYDIFSEGDTIYFADQQLICYHFSGFRVINENEYELCNRKKISSKARNIYSIYVDEIRKALMQINSIDNSFMETVTGKKHFNHYFVLENMINQEVPRSKMKHMEILQEHPIISQHLPETLWYNHSNLKRMLTCYQTVYIKPDTGFQGNGIIRLKKVNKDHCMLSYDNFSKKISLYDLLLELEDIMADREYVIQQGIDLATYKNCPFDIRMLMQKPYYTWELTLTSAKVARQKNAVVTNVSKGAQDYPLKDILKKIDQNHDAMSTLKELVDFAHQAANILDYKLSLSIIGFDMAIDRQGKVWLIEANTRPLCEQCKLVNDESSVERYSKAKEVIKGSHYF